MQNLDDTSREKLLKLLRLTTSNRDGEVCAAIRKANSLLATAGTDWDGLLSPIMTYQNGHQPTSVDENRENLHVLLEMCAYVLESPRLRPGMDEFILSLKGRLEAKHPLTMKQEEALIRVWRGVRNAERAS